MPEMPIGYPLLTIGSDGDEMFRRGLSIERGLFSTVAEYQTASFRLVKVLCYHERKDDQVSVLSSTIPCRFGQEISSPNSYSRFTSELDCNGSPRLRQRRHKFFRCSRPLFRSSCLVACGLLQKPSPSTPKSCRLFVWPQCMHGFPLAQTGC